MDVDMVCLVYHFGGRWVHLSSLTYVDGNEFSERGDIDFLSFTHMVKKYRVEFGMENVTKLYYLIPGETLDNGLKCMEDDSGLKELVGLINQSSDECDVHIYPWECNVRVVGTQSSVINDTNNGGSTSNLQPTLPYRDEIDDYLNFHDEIGVETVVTNVEPNEGEIQVHSENEGEIDLYDGGSESDDQLESDEIDMQLISQSMRKVRYNVDDRNPFFLVGMTFANAKEARFAIARYSIANSRLLKVKPNEPKRLRAKCIAKGCPFVLFISADKDGGLSVKTFKENHQCLRDSNNPMASAKLLAIEFKDMIYQFPKLSAKGFQADVEKMMRVYVSTSKCKRAKKIVTEELDGSYVVEYGYLGAYIEKLMETNPGSTTQLDLCEKSLESGKIVFKRLYICFDSLKRGWKAGCRPIIGLDGCHLKGKVRGQLLVVVGQDGDDQLFPIAWAVIAIENKDVWAWFLELLAKDLEITDNGRSLTIMSDMQKGLVQAVNSVLPAAEHRYCARHVYSNWSKKWSSGELKKKFWMCAWSTYNEEFEDNLNQLGDISKDAAIDLMKYNPQCWSRAFFSTRCKSPLVHNNICECFNWIILDARFKPVVSMLTDIRLDCMKRLATNKAAADSWINEWSPTCMDTYQFNMDNAFGCRVYFNGQDGYEIVDREDRHTVHIKQQSCTCRAWDLSGIPCSHAICAMHHSNIDPKTYISHWYHKCTYMAAYEHALQPMPGFKMMQTDRFEKLDPPHVVKPTGRPKKKRIRSSNERRKGQTSGKLSKKGVTMTCSICHSKTHNMRTCPQKIAKMASNTETSKSQQQSTIGEQPGNSNTQPQQSATLGDQVGTSNSQPQSFIAASRPQQNSNKKRKYTATNNQPKATSKKQVAAKRKSRRNVGLGVFTDELTGNITINPGMSGETIIRQRDPIASQQLSSNPDPVTRYPIPSEKDLRKERTSVLSKSNGGSRKITFAADGRQSIVPTNLPFKPPGLQWEGKQAMTTGQLERARDKKKAKLLN